VAAIDRALACSSHDLDRKWTKSVCPRAENLS